MNEQYETINEFDREYGMLDGLPGVTRTKETTIRAKLPMIGIARSFIVQTVRMKEKGDTIFLETVEGEKAIRLVLPPAVADAIARQRDALTAKVRSKAAKQTMADRMARGEKPGFLLHKGRKKA